jgi:hypothetical protein
MLSVAYAVSFMLSVACKPYMLSVIMLSFILLSVVTNECHYAEFHYTEFHYTECRYAAMLSVVAPYFLLGLGPVQ